MKRTAGEERLGPGCLPLSGEIPKPGRETMGKRWFCWAICPNIRLGVAGQSVAGRMAQSCLRMSGRTAKKNSIGAAWDLL